MSLVLQLSIHSKPTRVQVQATVKHWGHHFFFFFLMIVYLYMETQNKMIHTLLSFVGSICGIFAPYADSMPRRGMEIRL